MHTSNLHADPSNYRALIAGISFDEKSGFVLRKLSTAAEYGNTGASLKNLVIQTQYSDIKNQTSIQYQNLDELKKHPGNMVTNLEFDRSPHCGQGCSGLCSFTGRPVERTTGRRVAAEW